MTQVMQCDEMLDHPRQLGAWAELGLLELEVEDADRVECGEVEPTDPRQCRCADQAAWVLAAPFRAHVRRLITGTGLPWRTIAVLAAVPSPALRRLLHGRGGRPIVRLHPHIAARLYLLTADEIAGAASRLRACRGTRMVLQLLLDRGWGLVDLAHRSGLPIGELEAIVDGRLECCSQLTVATVRALAQALWRVPAGPAGNRR